MDTPKGTTLLGDPEGFLERHCKRDSLVLREVTGAGGEAALLEARFVDGLADADIESLFRTARDVDYAALGQDAREVETRWVARAPDNGDARR